MNPRALAALVGVACSARAVGMQPDNASEARAHAEKGVQCAQASDLICAETELRRAVALTPNDSSYLTSLGGILGMQQKLEPANLYFERAVNSDPDNAAARRNLAANQWRLGQLKSAQANLERLLRSEPQDKAATLLLGMVSENEHDYVRSAKLLSSVPELVEQRPESVAALASDYYHTGRRDQAHKILEGLPGQTGSPQGIFAAAGVAAQADDLGIAEKLFESIQSSYPDRAIVQYNLALIQFRTGRIADSKETLIALVNTGRANAKAYNLLGRCYEKENAFVDAIRAINDAIRLTPNEESNYHDLVTILMNSNRLAAALEVSRKTTEAFPRSALASLDKAVLEMKMDEFTDAVKSYSRAIQLDPRSLDAKVGLASAKWAAGMRTEAETEYQALLKQHPQDASLYQSFGTSLSHGANDEVAINRAATLLRKAVALDGSCPEAHYQLGLLNLKKSASGSLPQALEQLEEAARLGLNDSKIHYALATAYRRVRRETDASREMNVYEKLKAAEDDINSLQMNGALQGK